MPSGRRWSSLHLLNDPGWLSRGRDGGSSGRLAESDLFIQAALASKHQRWVDGARGLSLPSTLSAARSPTRARAHGFGDVCVARLTPSA